MKIKIKNQEINYKIRKSKRAKRISIAVLGDASVVVTKPAFVPDILLRKFLREKIDWIKEKVDYFEKHKNTKILGSSKIDYIKKRARAFFLVRKKIEKYNQIYNFKFNKIVIRNQKTRWGSCSAKGNLNFNYRLVYLPERLADYIVVHELCHLKEMNHSRKFWNLVARVFPDYLKIRKQLKKEGILLI